MRHPPSKWRPGLVLRRLEKHFTNVPVGSVAVTVRQSNEYTFIFYSMLTRTEREGGWIPEYWEWIGGGENDV